MSLIHWWPLNGDLLDRGSNPKHGSIIGSANVTTSGILGKCLSGMSGSQTTAGVSVSNCNLLDEISNEYSAAMWIKVHGTHVHYEGAFISSGDWNNKRWTFGINQANNRIQPLTNASNQNYISLGKTLTNDQWYHVATVYKDGKASLYLDGVLINTINATAPYQSSATNLTIGRETYASGYFSFNGDICDVRIYDHALSIREIQELSKGLMLHYTFNDNRNRAYYDESGYNNDGTQNQITYTSNSNNGSYCASFNGTHSYIEVPNWKPTLPNEPYTIAFWVNPGENKTRDVYFGNYPTTNGTFNIERNTSNYLRVYYNSDTPIGPISAITIPSGVWTHIVMTFDGATFKAYKDGVEKYSKALSQTLSCTNANWKIGSDYRTAVGTSEATRYKGLMSDFRIYASALTPAQVLELYESKAEIDKNQNVFTNEIIEQNEVANMVNLGSWEQGGIQDASGVDANNMNNRARTKYIPVLPNTPYYFQAASGWDIRGVHFYRKDNAWISYTTIGNAGVRTTPEDCYYVRLIIQNDNASLDALIANVATFGPVMVPGSAATTSDMGADTDVQVTKTYQIKTKDICENHDVGFFKDGTASGNNFYEI